MRDLAHYIERHQPDPGNEVGRWARQFLAAAGRSALSSFSPGCHRASIRLPLPAAGSEGNPAAVGDAAARPWQLPRLRHADDRGGALARSRRAVCLGLSRGSARRSGGTDERLGARVDPRLGANLSAGRGLDRFRPDERQRRQDRSGHRCGRARSDHGDPAPRHLHRVPRTTRHGGASERHVGATPGH